MLEHAYFMRIGPTMRNLEGATQTVKVAGSTQAPSDGNQQKLPNSQESFISRGLNALIFLIFFFKWL